MPSEPEGEKQGRVDGRPAFTMQQNSWGIGWLETGDRLVMDNPGTTANQAERLRRLLDRLRSGELQLAEAKALRIEVMNLVASKEHSCERG
jgi:hypothetical protein